MGLHEISFRLLSRALPFPRMFCAIAPVDSSMSRTALSPPESKPLYRRLSAVGIISGGSVSETMKEWLNEGRRVTEAQLMNFVCKFRKYKSYKIALELMDWMESQHMVGSHAVHIDLLSKVKGIRMAEEYFCNLPAPAKHLQTYGALLCCYCSKKMKHDAFTIYEKMKELELVSCAFVHNNLMSLYLKLGQPEEVHKLFEEMKASNNIPDKCSYKILIESYAMLNNIDAIENIVQEMEGKEDAWHWSVYCHLAAIYNSSKLFEKARLSLKKAELLMCPRDLSPFPFLISLYAGAGDLIEVKRVWKLLKDRIKGDHLPTNKLYLVMLQALKNLDDFSSLKELFEEWESVCVSYEVKLVSTVIEAYLERDMVEEAIILLEKATEEGAHPLAKSFWLITDYYLSKGKLDQVRRWSRAASSMIKNAHSAKLEFE
ncbi:hypothetical protein HPP92_013049 [Vanilla planifolia]|uniref:Pentatricopeptide repeat-containing protein n=1 Tax=Vanilla planifolia TaxID=51239 RepID=A0A835UZM6_VANPL|nr:hypothetical protein HPP92_013049 [Vanilla planifolia]